MDQTAVNGLGWPRFIKFEKKIRARLVSNAKREGGFLMAKTIVRPFYLTHRSKLFPLSTRLLISLLISVIACSLGGNKRDRNQASLPPDTRITAGPDSIVGFTHATFVFESTQPGSRFSCQIDNQPAETCLSPKTYDGLSVGNHDFSVAATSPADTVDKTPATADWTINLDIIDTEIATNVPVQTTSSSLTIQFRSNRPDASFICMFDNIEIPSCNSPAALSFAIGPHDLLIKAVLGSQSDITPAVAHWTRVEPDPNHPMPVTTIDLTHAPLNPSASRTAVFAFSAEPSGASFDCALDSMEPQDYSSCVSGITYRNLLDGSHTFYVKASLNGTEEENPRSYTWIIDTFQFGINLTNAPPNNTDETVATFEFSANDPNAVFTCSLDGTPLNNGSDATCVSPITTSDLPPAKSHTFSVNASLSGEEDVSIDYDWFIKEKPPTIELVSPIRPDGSGNGFYTTLDPIPLVGPVADDLGIARLILNGEEVDLSQIADRRNFDLSDLNLMLTPLSGMNPISLSVVDGSNNSTSVRQSLIAGDFLPFDSTELVPDAAQLRINEELIDEVEKTAAQLVPDALNLLIGTTLKLTDVCPTYKVTSITYNGLDLQIDPQTGKLAVTIVVDTNPGYRFQVQLHKEGSNFLCPTNPSVSAQQVTGVVDLFLAIGQTTGISVTSGNTTIDLIDLVLNCDGNLICGALRDLFLDESGLVKNALRDALKDQLPPVLERQLNDLLAPQSLTVSLAGKDATVAVALKASKIDVDDAGITLTTNAGLAIENPILISPGSLLSPASLPEPPKIFGFSAAFSDDLLNCALMQFWRGAVLNLNLADITGGNFDLGGLPLLIELSPKLPPIFTLFQKQLLDENQQPTGSFENRVGIDIGNFDIQLSDHKGTPADPSDDNFLLEAAIFANASATITPINNATTGKLETIVLGPIKETDGTTAPGTGMDISDFDIQVVRTGTGSVNGLPVSLLVPLLKNLFPQLLPMLISEVGVIPIPATGDFSLLNVDVTLDGGIDNQPGYLSIHGSIELGQAPQNLYSFR